MKTEETVELIIEDGEVSTSVKELTIEDASLEIENDGTTERHAVGREEFNWSMDVELENNAVDTIYEIIAQREFKNKARALFALIGLWHASSGDMSVEQHFRKLLTSRY